MRGVKAAGHSASFMAAITSPNFSGHDDLLSRSLGVTGQAQVTHDIDESCGEVQSPPKLTSRVIKGEGVVVVMEALT